MQKIKVDKISKSFASKVVLKDVSLEIEKGKIYGLLGRNGAGKSTLLRIISGRMKADLGQVLYEIDGQSKELMSGDLYFSEPKNLVPENMNVQDFLKYTQYFYPRMDKEETLDLLAKFHIGPKEKVRNLSTGNYSILRAMVALHSGASFIFLDEPTLGHDAINRALFYDEVLRVYGEEKPTILLSTHLIDEVSHLLEEVIFIRDGHILLNNSVEHLLNSYAYLTGPKESLASIENQYKVLQKKEQLGFLSLLVQREKDSSSLPSNVEVESLGLQDLFIALNQNK